MEFTFGIITAGGADHLIQQTINTIRDEAIPNYEIIIVGQSSCSGNDVRVIPFDESIKQGWITRKKNMICQSAKYENIVLLHDYVTIVKGWYAGFLTFGNSFDVCITPIHTIHNTRFRDYTLYPQGMASKYSVKSLLPYTYKAPLSVSRLMYISGAYYIVKKIIALQFPLREELFHGAGEDVIFCHDLARAGIVIQCNQYSQAKFMKHKPQCDWEKEIDADHLTELENLDAGILHEYFEKQEHQIHSWLFSTFGIVIQRLPAA